MTSPPRSFAISAGGTRALLAPALGGAVLSCSDRDGEFLRGDEGASDPLDAACFPCVPWFGRLYGPLAAPGDRRIDPTHRRADGARAIHGHGWRDAWDVVEAAADRLICRHAHDGATPGTFPFAYVAEQEISVGPDGLTMSLLVRNEGEAPMPAGLALHPFFIRRAETRVAFEASARWTMPDPGEGKLDKLTGALGSGAAAPLPATTLDHSFVGFGGVCRIEGASTIILRTNAPILHLYAPAGEDYFCLEPTTHLPGRFGDPAPPGGSARLAPGERLSVALALTRA